MNKNALFKISYGLFVLTSKTEDKHSGCIINTAMQISENPLRVCISINKANYTHELVMQSKKFNVSILSEEADFDIFKHFGFQCGRDIDKFAEYDSYKLSENGLAYVTKGTNAFISAEVEETIDSGSHTLFIAKVTEAEILSDVPSTTYEYYQNNIKPKPEKPAYSDGTVWVCKVCGYKYEGEVLPEDYICPLCKHPASDFEKI
ncbi:hypothetical protein HMPREF0380_01166 [Eubacterium infirmum F0142]|nr:hypothetical protein HMPREF0380_01166 [Eubacterium infirmum F0142]